MRTIPLLTATICLGVAADAVGREHWSSFQNGGQCEGHSELPLNWSSDGPGIAWRVRLEGYGQSTPVIWDDSVYVTFCSGENKERLHLRALELQSGKLLWAQEFANSTPQESSNYVSRAAPTPAVDAAGVIALYEGGNLIALDHAGKVRWERDLTQAYGPIAARHGLASSLEQNDQYVFVWIERSAAPYILAVAKSNGETAWKADGLGRTAWSSPRLVEVGDNTHLVLSAKGRIVGLDPTSGNRLWQFDEVAGNTTATPMPVGDGRFLIGASPERGAASGGNAATSCGVVQISQQTDGGYAVSFLWRAKKASCSFGSPIASDGNAYFVNRSGVVYCVDLDTGEQHYAKRTNSSTWATPMGSGNRIYLFGRNGTTTVIRDGNKFEALSTNTLWETDPGTAEEAAGAPGAGRFSGPVLYASATAGKRIVLRTGDTVYCISE